jgi:hypothetical protein
MKRTDWQWMAKACGYMLAIEAGVWLACALAIRL